MDKDIITKTILANGANIVSSSINKNNDLIFSENVTIIKEEENLNNNKVNINNISNLDYKDNTSINISDIDIDDLNILDTTITLNCKVVYKRKFGKKLAFLTALCKNNKEHEIMVKENDYVDSIKIGDTISFKGKYIPSLKDNKYLLLIVGVFSHLKSDNKNGEVNSLRKVINEVTEKKNEDRSICKLFKETGVCKIKDCSFKHFLSELDKIKIDKLKTMQVKMFNQHHENDPLLKEDKQHKSVRNKLFADFIVNTYGLEYLSKGIILDIAGGKGKAKC